MSLNVENSRDGYKILQVDVYGKKQYIGSKYNQKREIDKFIESFSEFTANDNYIVFGLGFAEHIQELLKLISLNSKILIIELNQELVQYCKDSEEISEILKDERIHIAKEENEFKEFFDKYITEININNMKIGFYCRYDNIYKDKLNLVYKVLKDETTRITSNRNTKLHYGETWVDLLLDNLKHMAQGVPVNDFKDKYKNTPAIIVSAGPSLNKNIDKLKGVGNALIISGGRTLRALCERDIDPDYLCVVDPVENSYKLVEDYIGKVKCPLVFYEGTNADIVNGHKAKKIFSSNNKFISNVLKSNIQSLSGGGSVAHSMTILAAYMGCNPIVFIGQDLAYTGEEAHAKCAEDNEKTFFDYKKEDDIYVEDIYGGIVRTSVMLNRFRVALEEIIRVFPNIKFINATEGGVKIKGAENRKLENVLSEFESRKVISMDTTLKEGNKVQYVIEKLNDILNKFNEYTLLYSKRKLILEKLKSNYNFKNELLVGRNIEELNFMDKELKTVIKSFDIIESALFTINYKAENCSEFIVISSDSEEQRFMKNINKDEFKYSEIKIMVEKYSDKIKKVIDDFNNM